MMQTAGMNEKAESDIRDLLPSIAVLMEDIQFAETVTKKEPTAVAHRAFVRCVFSTLEGAVSLLSNPILRGGERGELDLSAGQLKVLRQWVEREDDQGNVVRIERHIRFPKRARLVLKLLLSLSGRDEPKGVSGADDKGWRDLERAIEIRNRLVHPDDASSFDLSRADVQLVRDVHLWFVATIAAVGCAKASGTSPAP